MMPDSPEAHRPSQKRNELRLSRRYYRAAALLLLSFVFVASIILIFRQGQSAAVPQEVKLLLDTRPEPSSDELAAAIEQELPSLPYAFYERHRDLKLRYNATCAPYPNLYALHHQQNYWQLHRTADVQFHLYGAYYDTRPAEPFNMAIVRILAMVNRLQSGGYSAHFCQLWFEWRRKPFIVPVRVFRPIWMREWGYSTEHLYPHLLDCAVPVSVARGAVPQTVSLVASKCARATNNLRVVYRPLAVNASRGGFAVCVKGLDYPYADMSARFVEWLELLRVLGAEKVIAYELQLHANISKVLRHYQRSGFVDLRRLTLVRGVPNAPSFRHKLLRANQHRKRLDELIPYNDCFYRNMYRYEYIAVLDFDEVIMPLGNLSSWRDIVNVSPRKCRPLAALCFRNIYFPDYPDRQPWSPRAPAYHYLLQHVLRVQVHQPKSIAVKCLHNTSLVVTVHNHMPFAWVKCAPAIVNETLAQLQHYRQPLYNKSSVATPVLDDNIWRFQQPLVQRTRQVLTELGFLTKGQAGSKFFIF